MPPRHGKTTTIAHAFPFLLSKDPKKTHCYVTYSGDLSKSKSRHIRRLALESGIKLAKGSKSLTEWRTEAGGGLIATSIGGSLTGQGVTGLMVVDDPFKDRVEAESKAHRNNVWEWFTDVAYTRLEPGSSCVVVQTRWHEEDLIGRLMTDFPGEWEYINLPAVSDEGQALWPEAYPLEVLNKTRSVLGDYSFEALYQGRPRPRGSNIFKEPATFVRPDMPQMAEFMVDKDCIMAIDPAATARTSADNSVALVLAKERKLELPKAWVLEVIRGQMTVPAFCEVVARRWDAWKQYRCKIAIEAVGGFKAVPDILAKIRPGELVLSESGKIGNLLPIYPTKDKYLRAQAVAAAWNEGRILVPNNTDWCTTFVDEVMGFTGLGDRKDDQVDALAHAWNTLSSIKRVRRGYRISQDAFG
jgi:predicted phage terminase large subunit-like protein